MQTRCLRQLIAAFVLGGYTLLGTALVALIYDSTAERIEENQHLALLRQLNLIIPSQSRDNDLLCDAITISAPENLNASATRVYQARKDGQPVTALFSPVIARGYAGPIQLIVAVYWEDEETAWALFSRSFGQLCS